MMRNKLLIPTTLIGIGLIILTFQNCGPAFEAMDTEPVAIYVNSSLPLTAGSSKTNPFTCSNETAQPVKPIFRLTRDQYSNTLKNLLGPQIHAQAEPLISSLYEDVLKKNVRDFSNTITDTQMTAYQSIAELVYNTIQANTSISQSLAGNCITQAPVTATCRDNFLRSFGLKALRRPLTDAEVTHWGTKVFALGATGSEGVALTAYGMLLSPSFLLRLELGDPLSPSTDTFDLTPYEVAARLSYDLTDSPPDQALLNAAAANQLSTPEQLKPHVDRLMESSLGKAKVIAFFNFWLDPRKYSASAFTSEFLQGLDVNAVNEEFAREMNQYIEYSVYTKRASLKDLLTSRESFARTPAVASIYGHAPVPNGSSPALMSSERKGLLMRGPVLATEGNETHPILRGVKLRTRFLCEVMGFPSGVSTNDSSFFTDLARSQMSTRARTEGLTSDKSCAACHSLINPVGFAFENFDGLGRVRDIEKAYSLSGEVLGQHTINTSSTNVNIGGGQIRDIQDGPHLIDSLLQENMLPACFLRQSYRFFKTQEETAADGCSLREAYNKLMVISDEAPLLEALKSAYLHHSIFKRRF